jgi:hypothetical protein
MTHVGKKLAKLNAKTVTFGAVAGGGTPEFISTDYAAALAFMSEGIGRELLIFIWWPDGASKERLCTYIDRILMNEWRERTGALTTAELMAFSGAPRSQATRAKEIAMARKWPGIVTKQGDDLVRNERYSGVRNAVLHEMRHAGQCKVCKGRCSFTDADGVEFECVACLATGREKSSDRWRAEASGVGQTHYRDAWNRVYEWLIRELRAALATAEVEYERSLSG